MLKRIIGTAAFIAIAALAQVAEKTIPAPAQMAAGGAPPAAQFTHEQKDALKDAALLSLVADKQVVNAKDAADKAAASYVDLLKQTLAKIGACAGATVDLSFTISCPGK